MSEHAPKPPAGAPEVPGFQFVDHVAIAVPAGSLEEQVAAYGLLGFREIHREEVGGGDQVREALLQVGEGPNLVQLLEPLGDDSPVAKWLERNGGRGGLHHVGYRVADVHAAHRIMRAQGFRLLDEAPRPGSRGTTVFFVHPKSRPDVPFQVLIEVVQA